MVSKPSTSQLTATYEIELSRAFRVKRAEGDELRYEARIGEFCVSVVLVRNGGARYRGPDDQYETSLAKKVQLHVTRAEGSKPPPTPRNAKGGRDVGERAEWIREREDGYRDAAVTALNRLIRFFKYTMKTPQLSQFSEHEDCLLNPDWYDEDHNKLDPGIVKASGRLITSRGWLGERDFTVSDDVDLEACLDRELEPEVFQDFLSDAQTSILGGKLARASLELAIACEVAVKQLFFGAGTVASAVLEHLQDKQHFNIRVIELLVGAAQSAFGESFKQTHPRTFEHIVFLFRCRNQVAHRGKLTYRDDGGRQQIVNRRVMEQWWKSVDTLMAWIEQHRSGSDSTCEGLN